MGTNGGNTLLYLNDGDGSPYDSLPAIVIGTLADNTTSLALGDVDKDGDLDLIVGNNGTSTKLYLNDGRGVFSAPIALGTGATTAVLLADVDKDGDLDLILGNNGGGTKVHLNKGVTGSIWSGFDLTVAGTTEVVTAATTSLAAGDVDKDGFVDLVVGITGAASVLYRNKGITTGPSPTWNGFDTAAPVAIGAAAATTAVALDDLNGDGFLDVVAAVSGAPSRLYLSTTTGTTPAWSGFATGTNISADATTATSLVLADIDVDGKVDVIIGNSGATSRIYRNTGVVSGAVTFAAGVAIGSLTSSTKSLALGDLDGDGKRDLVLGNSGSANRFVRGTAGLTLGDGETIGSVTLSLPAGPYLRISGSNLSLTVLGQTLTGSFAFTQQIVNAARVVTVTVGSAAAPARISLVDGLATVDVYGSLVLGPGGLAGSLTLSSALTLGGLTFTGGLKLSINTGSAPVLLPDGITRLPGGPYFRIEGDPVVLTLGTGSSAATFSGSFAIEQTTNSLGQRRVAVAFSNGTVSLGTVLPNVLTNAQGVFVVLPAISGNPGSGGFAGTLSGTVNLALVPELHFAGTFGLSVNQTNRRITETVTVGGRTLVLDVAAGPYTRVFGNGVELTVLGQTLRGDFALESSLDGTTNVVVVAANNVSLSLGGVLTVTNASGAFLLTAKSGGGKALAGRLSGTVALTVPGVTLSGTLGLELNDTGLTVTKTIDVGGAPFVLSLDAGRYLRVKGTNVSLDVLGQRLTGTFSFEETKGAGPNGILGDADDTRTIKAAIGPGTLYLGDPAGNFGLELTAISGQLLVGPAGVAGDLQATATLRGIQSADFSLSSPSVRLQFNSTNRAVDETFDLGGTPTSLVLPFGPFVRVQVGTLAAPLTVTAFGQLLTGAFSFEQVRSAGPDGVLDTSDDRKVIKLAAAGVSLFLGDDGGTPGTTAADVANDVGVRLTGGSAKILITSEGVAGEITGTATIRLVPGAFASATIRVSVNTLKRVIGGVPTPIAVDEAFVVGGVTERLQLPVGPYLRVEASNVELLLFSQRLTGDFVFEQVGTTKTVTAKNVALRIGTDQRDFVVVSNGQGVLTLVAGGVYGRISASVAVDIPSVSVTGTFALLLNTTATSQTVAGAPFAPGLKVTGTNVNVDVLGQRLTGSFSFAKNTSTNTVTLEIENAKLELGNGTTAFIRADLSGSLKLTREGIDASVAASVTFLGPLASVVSVTAPLTLTVKTSKSTPGGPLVRLEAGKAAVGPTPAVLAEITVLGQSLSGVFSFEQRTTQAGIKIVRIGFSDVSLFLGDPVGAGTTDDEGVLMTGGSGAFLITPQGVAGEFGATSVGLTSALQAKLGFSASAALKVQFNNLGTAVNETLTVGGAPVSLILPAGPYVKATVSNATLVIGGVTLTANLSFERGLSFGVNKVRDTPAGATVPTGDDKLVTKIGFSNLNVGETQTIAGVSENPGLKDGQGAFVVYSGATGGVAGVVSGKAKASVGAFSLDATIGFSVNTTGGAVDEKVEVAGTTIDIVLAASPTFLFNVQNLDFDFGGLLEIHGNFSVGSGIFQGFGLEIFIGKGPPGRATGRATRTRSAS